MFIKVEGQGPRQGYLSVSLRCPSCRQIGTFETLSSCPDMDVAEGKIGRIAGQRRCPNNACHAHVFFVGEGNKVLVSYPAERLDFDASDIPAAIAAAFEEAITCHANSCYIASAIMVRKTLELVCTDRGIKSGNLKVRIKQLQDTIMLPKELLEGLDDLRLLGNDAAHVESETFSQIGQEELEVAIDFTKEVLKGVYQYAALLNRFRSLKKSS